MLRYDKERHLSLLKERLGALQAVDLLDSAVMTSLGDALDPDQREEAMRRLMVRDLGRLRSKQPMTPEFFGTLDAFLARCDPTDLRQMDVLHNVYEALQSVRPLSQTLGSRWHRYAELLRVHKDRLVASALRPYRVGLGDTTILEPRERPLRALILADNFLSGSRIWQQVDEEPTITRPQILFCNNTLRSPLFYFARLLLSVCRLCLRGQARLGMSMIRGRPRMSLKPLDHTSNADWLRAQAFDVGLHNMGVIYRSETIATFRLGILNAHIGHLPGMRGRSVLEWSLVFGVEPCVSTFFVDEGIDTGTPIVDRFVPPSNVRGASLEAAKRRLSSLDGLCYRRALTKLVRGGEGILNTPAGLRFYVMSELLASAITVG